MLYDNYNQRGKSQYEEIILFQITIFLKNK